MIAKVGIPLHDPLDIDGKREQEVLKEDPIEYEDTLAFRVRYNFHDVENQIEILQDSIS